MNKFIKRDKKYKLENRCDCSLNEQDHNYINLGQNNNREREVIRKRMLIIPRVSYFNPKKFHKLKIIKTYLR